MAYLHGEFRNTNNDLIRVEMKSPEGVAEYVIDEDTSQIHFAGDPIEITSECDSLFEVIIKKSAKITLVTTHYLGEYLFAANEKSVTVKIYKNDVIIFDGYVEPNTFSQPWAYEYETFDINCIDKLSCLQYEYPCRQTEYRTYKEQNNVYSFKKYLSDILPANTYWDNSKTTDGQPFDKNIFDMLGVSLNVFLGEDEEDMMNNEEILFEILQYLNLHIIQEGEDFIIFDWKSIYLNDVKSWPNVFTGNTSLAIDNNTMEIKGEHYAGDDTNLSMSEVYNQIIAKCEFETRDEVLGSMLDSDKITPYVNIKQKFLREYVSAGEGSRAQNGFKEIVKSGQNGAIPYSSYDAWYCREWYFKWNFNPDWQLRYNLRDIESVLETDSNGNYINQWKILQKMKQTRFFPALVSVGKSSVELSYKNQKQNGTIEMDDYLVISCNGNRENTEEAATKFDNDNITAAGGQGYLEDNGILKYIGGESGMFSPRDEETTNYVIFSGSMILNPVMDISGSSFWGGMYRVNKPDTTFSEVLSTVDYLMKGNTCPVSNNGDGGFYCQQFYTSVKPTDEQTPNNSINLIYPFVNEDKQKSLAYNYSDKGDKTDKFDKVPVLECELRIGDSYLEEYETGDKQKTAYRWTKARASFTIGIDPNIGDYIVGKEYELANTVNGRFSNERGTAIPIKKSDALTGEVHFKIIGLVNTWWNEITRRHPTMFRHTSYQDHYRLLLNNVSSIWLKSFNMKIISDNNGYDTGNSNKDLLYISLEQLDYLKKKDDITFKINTMPTTDELIRLGINSNVSNTNVVNMSNSTPLETIVSKGTKERPERIFIDEYYNLYSKPKVIMETTLKDNLNYPMQKMYNFTGFKNMIPMKNIQNLKYNTITLTLRQL